MLPMSALVVEFLLHLVMGILLRVGQGVTGMSGVLRSNIQYNNEISRRESGYSSRAQTPSSVHGGGMEVFDFGDLTG